MTHPWPDGEDIPKPSPRPGSGVVFINWLDREADIWVASWQHGPGEDGVQGTEGDVWTWVRAQPAEPIEYFRAYIDGWEVYRG